MILRKVKCIIELKYAYLFDYFKSIYFTMAGVIPTSGDRVLSIRNGRVALGLYLVPGTFTIDIDDREFVISIAHMNHNGTMIDVLEGSFLGLEHDPIRAFTITVAEILALYRTLIGIQQP